MKPFGELFSQSLSEAIGLTILHSLWQGLLLAVITGTALYALRHFPARARYRTSLAALMILPALAVLTFFKVYHPAAEIASLNSSEQQQLRILLAHPGISQAMQQEQQGSTLEKYLPLVTAVWLLGTLFFFLRFAGGIFWMQRLRYSAKRRLPYHFTEQTSRWQLQLNIRRKIRIAESALVQSPMLIGYLRPLILMPLGTVSALPQEQVLALLAHELAHIRRHDFLINLFQEIIAALFFFHPACWWLNQQIRNEREVCCDEQALQLGVESLDMVKALASVEERRQAATQLALAASGGSLISRVRLMLGVKNTPTRRERIAAILFIIIGFVIITASSTMAEARERNKRSRHDKIETGSELSDTTYSGDTTKARKSARLIFVPGDENGKGAVIIPGNGSMYEIPDSLGGDIVIRRDKEGNISSVKVGGKDYTQDVLRKLDEETEANDYEQALRDFAKQERDMQEALSASDKALRELEIYSHAKELSDWPVPPAPPAAPPAIVTIPGKKGRNIIVVTPQAIPGVSTEQLPGESGIWPMPPVVMPELVDLQKEMEKAQKELRRANRQLSKQKLPYVLVWPQVPQAPAPPDDLPGWNMPPVEMPDLPNPEQLKELAALEKIQMDSLRSKLAPLAETDLPSKMKNLEKLNAALADELLKDKLISDKKHFDFEITNSSLRVNGKQMDATQHAKYYGIVKKFLGELEGDEKLQLNY